MSVSELNELEMNLKKLDKFDNAYYNNNPIISDVAYDLFKDKIFRNLPPEHPRLSKVGHKICSAWPKEKHIISMGSQNKVSNEEEIKGWYYKVCKELNVESPKFVIQHKIDGFSLGLQYEDGALEKGVSRGDGNIGEDITPNVKMFRGLPNKIVIKDKVSCRGEGVIYKDDFKYMQGITENHFKNARNAASGISRRLDGSFSTYIRFIAFDVNAKVGTESEKISILNKMGFNTVPTYIATSLEDILEIYRTVRDKGRDTFPYEIDGLVLKLDDIDLQAKLGEKNNRPEGQIALKFASGQCLTTVKDIFIQIGRTGKLTPCALLEPVDLMGSTIRKATLHNFAYIKENTIGKGAEVVLEKKGEIIPQVVEVVNPGIPYENPKTCPSCGGLVEDDGVNIWCKNEGCKEREINRIKYWIQTLDMKGFSEKFIKKLWDLGKIRSVADLYKLTVDDFIAVEGIGEKTVKSFFKICEETSSMYLEKFITALGIPSCSKSTSEVLVKEFKTWERISNINADDIEGLPGFAKISSEKVCFGIGEVKGMANTLLSVIEIKEKEEGALNGKSFCVTGSLSNMSRKEFSDMVVDNGGTMKSSVVKGLDYLVTNDPDSGSNKNQKARKLGVKIINEESFFNLFDVSVVKEVKKEEVKSNEDSSIELISESLF